MSTKIDYKKQYNILYNPPKEFSVATVPPLQYLMIDGKGYPTTSALWQDAIESLFALSYSLKFELKKQDVDYTVMPLEGLFYTGSSTEEFDLQDPSKWHWTIMMMQPEQVTPALFEKMRKDVQAKKQLKSLSNMRLETFDEGLSVQIMYIGPYKDEPPTIDRMYAYMEENGYEKNGKHHEIYLGDPNRSAPEKLKTVIRQPIRKR